MASVAKRPAPLPKWFRFAFLLGCTPGFKKSRCKKLLKVTMRRIKLLKGRREVQVRQLRRDVAQLLQLGQVENAESRLDRLWKEHSLLSAYIKTGEYCQLVKANLRNIAGQRECPMDLKESLASLCFAASCCADLPELQEIRDIMVMKYGKDFLTSSAHELLPGEHVNRLFLDAFSTRQPLEVSKKALLKGILAEYNVVQPRKPKPPCIDGGLQKTASSDCNISHKQQSRHACGSNSESCKQHPNLNALEQEEKHNKSPKQIRHTTIVPTCGAVTEEHASSPQLEGDWERKDRRKKERKDSHFQVDSVQGGPNETDLASQDGPLRALSHDRHGKEKSRNRLKASKRNSQVNQVGQEDQHTSSNRMSIYEKTGPDERASEFMHGFGNTANEKSSLDKEVKDFVSRQYCVQEHGDFLHSHEKHRENKFSNEEYLAETKQEVLIAQPWKHGYHDEALSEDFNAHQMLQEGNHKKHDYVQREVHSRSNGKARSRRMRNEFDNVQNEREQCHADSNHAETESKHYSRSNRKDRFANEFDKVQQERSPHRRNHHEGGTQVDINHRLSKTLRAGKVANEIDNWQSPTIGYGISPEEREPPHADWETHSKHNSRSNGKSRPVRVTDQLDNNLQERSPRRRNHHVEGETKIEIDLTSDEKSRPAKVAYKIENWQPSPKGNGSLPDYVDDTHKVQREKRNSSKKKHEKAGTKALSGDHPNAHILQEGREHHARKHHFEETQQEAWPERATSQSPNSHIVHDNRYDSKYPARQRDGNLHLTENHPTGAKIVSCRDHKEARQNGSALEPCMDGEHLPGDNGHARQKHRRLARKHNGDRANSTVKVLDGDVEPKQERIAEEAVNGQTHWPFIPEDDSNYAAQGERTHFPQWPHQFDPKPKGRKGSIAVEARSLPQVHNACGMQKEQNYLESLDEHEDLVAKLSTCERVIGNSSPSRFSKPPQRPPPPVPPYRASSLPNRKPLNSPPVLPQRCATLETGHVRTNQELHVHPKLPEYEDLVASFAALRNKPARPPTY